MHPKLGLHKSPRTLVLGAWRLALGEMSQQDLDSKQPCAPIEYRLLMNDDPATPGAGLPPSHSYDVCDTVDGMEGNCWARAR